MPFTISPLQYNTNAQELSENNTIFSPNADSGIQPPATRTTPTNADHNYQKITILPLPPLQAPILLMTPMPFRVPTIWRTTPQFH